MAKKKKSKVKVLNQEEQYGHMISRYGTSSKYGSAILHLTYSEMVVYFGEQCEEFHPNCGNCVGWVEWQKSGTATISFERDRFVHLFLKGEI